MPTSVPAHHDEAVFLRALTHRIHSDLIASINTVSTAALRADNPAVKVALADVVALPEQHAGIHRALAAPDAGGMVDAADEIRKLAVAISRSVLAPIGVRLELSADTLPLEGERCWRLALAVHELVTNAARHACFDGREGAIKIKLSLIGSVVNCIVADNGSITARLKPGRGLRLVGELACKLGGRIEYGFGPQFSSFLVVFPLTERERRTNRVVASRRLRSARPRKVVPPQSRSQPTGAAFRDAASYSNQPPSQTGRQP